MNGLSVNGFFFPYQSAQLPDDREVWVLSGISRTNDSNCWRMHLAHVDDVEIEYFMDGAGDPLESLENAQNRMLELAEQLRSPLSVDERQRRPGPGRVRETGVTGVYVFIEKKPQGNTVIVCAMQQIYPADGGKPRALRSYTGRIREDEIEHCPEHSQRRFVAALKDAVALRRLYREKLREYGVLHEPVMHQDVRPEHYANIQLADLDVVQVIRHG